MNRLFVSAEMIAIARTISRPIALVILLTGLSGCATVPKEQEQASSPVSVQLGNSLASDAVKQLQTLYPPAHTTFNIEQALSKTDNFGNALEVQLRAKGYAVQITDPQQPAKAVAGINLHYTVDNPAAHWYIGLYRVQLVVGNVTLTRAYSAANNTAMPAGAWAKLE
jgi:hypothetical protein